MNNFDIGPAGLGRTEALAMACVSGHTAPLPPSIASQSSGHRSNLFADEPLALASVASSRQSRSEAAKLRK